MATARAVTSGQPDFGPNVFIFSPDMSQSEIQAIVNTVANQQVSNQFGAQRYALLFKPGTYGLKKDPQTGKPSPLTVQVGYYTMVAGLGQSPNDVVINGAVNSYDQCSPPSNNNNDNPGWPDWELFEPLSQLGLAQAYAKQGDHENSRKAYDVFFATWKNADPNIPILRQAKADYKKLTATASALPLLQNQLRTNSPVALRTIAPLRSREF